MKKLIFMILSVISLQNFLLSYQVEKSKNVKFSDEALRKVNREIEKSVLDIDKVKREYLLNNMTSVTNDIVNNILIEIDYRLRDEARPKVKEFYNTMVSRIANSYRTKVTGINYILKNKAFVFTETKIYDFEKIMEKYKNKYQEKLNNSGKNISQKEEVAIMLKTMDEILKSPQEYEYKSTTQLRLMEKEDEMWIFTEIEQN